MKLHSKLAALTTRNRPDIVDANADAAHVLPGMKVRVPGARQRVGTVETASRGGDAQVFFGAFTKDGEGNTTSTHITERLDFSEIEVQVKGTWVPVFE